jgi:hypothetical protein
MPNTSLPNEHQRQPHPPQRPRPLLSRLWHAFTNQPLIVQIVGGLTVLAIAVIFPAIFVPHSGNNAGQKGTPTPSSGVEGTVARTPRLGLEFWQNGAEAPMSFQPSETGDRDVVRVSMRPGPFELRFPRQRPEIAVRICAWTDSTIFSLQEGEDFRIHQFFGEGRGLVDYEYGSGTLYLDNQGMNYLVGTRIAHQSEAVDKVYFSQTWNGAPTSLSRQSTDLFMTIFINKNDDAKFQLGEYEYMVLHFTVDSPKELYKGEIRPRVEHRVQDRRSGSQGEVCLITVGRGGGGS